MSQASNLTRFTEKMGPDLGARFDRFHQETCWLNLKWIEYKSLYGHSEERLNTIYKISRHFFQVIEETLWQDVVLNISRMTAPIKSRGKPNLTIRILPGLVNPKDEQIMNSIVEDACNHAAPFNDWRNRWIAHRNLDHVLNASKEPLQAISRDIIDIAIVKLNAVMEWVQESYMNTTFLYARGFGKAAAEEVLVRLTR